MSQEEIWDRMNSAFKWQFGVGLEQEYNLFAGRMVSTREDEQDFTPEQVAWLKGFEAAQ